MRGLFVVLFALAVLSPLSACAGGHAGAPPPAEPLTSVPATVSPEAQDYYRNWRPRPDSGKPVDWRDPEQAAFMRKMLGRMFQRNLAASGLEYEMQRAESEVEAYWIRSGGALAATGRSLIYLHGGGFVLGSAQTNLVTPIRVSAASGLPVLSVEYRLAPEHPFPAGLEDCLAAYQWLLDEGVDPQSIGIFGDSAGGGLTVSLALKIREAGLPQPGALVAISPAVDLSVQGDTQATLLEHDIVLGPPQPARYRMYAGDYSVDHPLVSPVNADLTGLAPLLIQVGTRERLLSDSVRLAREARRDGVPVTLDVWEGMWHGWHDHPEIPEATQATAAIAAFFATQLRPRAMERAVGR